MRSFLFSVSVVCSTMSAGLVDDCVRGSYINYSGDNHLGYDSGADYNNSDDVYEVSDDSVKFSDDAAFGNIDLLKKTDIVPYTLSHAVHNNGSVYDYNGDYSLSKFGDSVKFSDDVVVDVDSLKVTDTDDVIIDPESDSNKFSEQEIDQIAKGATAFFIAYNHPEACTGELKKQCTKAINELREIFDKAIDDDIRKKYEKRGEVYVGSRDFSIMDLVDEIKADPEAVVDYIVNNLGIKDTDFSVVAFFKRTLNRFKIAFERRAFKINPDSWFLNWAKGDFDLAYLSYISSKNHDILPLFREREKKRIEAELEAEKINVSQDDVYQGEEHSANNNELVVRSSASNRYMPDNFSVVQDFKSKFTNYTKNAKEFFETKIKPSVTSTFSYLKKAGKKLCLSCIDTNIRVLEFIREQIK